MPLGTSLQSDILDMCNDPGATAAECATDWSDVMSDYAAGVVPTSAAVTAAVGTLQGALSSAFSAPSGTGVALLETAFLAFAATIAGGMAPAFVATPPAGPVGFSTLVATTNPSTAASAMAAKIDTWMRTGSATPAAGGAPVPWS